MNYEIVTETEQLEDGYVKETTYKVYEDGSKVEVCSVTYKPQPPEPQPEPEPQNVNISREDFDLLDVTYAETIYTITEDDGTITIMRGEF